MPRGQHDRTIAVHLQPSMAKKEVLVTVDYRLEVDELTVVLQDMLPFLEEVQYDRYKNKRLEFYREFTRIYAPILGRNLVAKVDGTPIAFQCDKRSQTLTDDDGKELNHLRCDFVFAARFPITMREQQQTFAFHEGNYVLQSGQIKLTWDFMPHNLRSAIAQDLLYAGNDWVALVKSPKAPSAALQAKTPLQLEPGEEEQLRDLVLPISWGGISQHVFTDKDLVKSAPAGAKAPPRNDSAAESGSFDLFHVFLTSDQGIVVVLLLSALVGAAHALTPGHGKTLVAAYLVGQRGTVRHALILGLVTTITHTGIVLLIALGLLFVDEGSRQAVAQSLGLIMGLALVCLGVWLLLQRLAGRADHFHLPGQSHHHHYGDHFHPNAQRPVPEQEPSIRAIGQMQPSRDSAAGMPLTPHNDESPQSRPLTWAGLLIMGMTGGIAPCWDAVAMLVLAIGMNLLWLALPMLLAFSAGLASVLVAIGILVVHARKLLDARWSNSRLVRLLPIVSALFITGMGILVCYQGVQGEDHDQAPRPAAAARP